MSRERGSLVGRLLRPLVDIRPREVPRALLLTADLFVLLLAYYLLKTAREVLLLGAPGARAELKTYSSAVQSVLLIGLSLGYGALAGRLARRWLLIAVTSFFAAQLLLFFGLIHLASEHRLLVGIVFFIWLGCFNVLIIAQFWTFANDLYDRADGERLFPLLAFGGTLGAVAGSSLSKPIFARITPSGGLLVAAALLLVVLALALAVDRGELAPPGEGPDPPRAGAGPVLDSSGPALLWRDGYLRLIALLALVKNWLNGFGEYLLDRRMLEAAHQRGGGPAAVLAYIAGFKSDYLTYVNLVALVVQVALVSRVLRRLGVGGSLCVLPLIVTTGYGTALLLPSLAVLLAVKVSENGVDYSLQKTAEQALYLVTSRSAKYKAKAIADTVSVRLGDVLAALVVAGALWLSLSLHAVVGVALLLAGATLALSAALRARHRRLDGA